MKFKKEDLIVLVDGFAVDGFKIVEDKLSGTSRWSVIYRLVFGFEGKFYSTSYRYGATEMQEENPFDYDEEEIECEEVVPVEETITVYKRVKPE